MNDDKVLLVIVIAVFVIVAAVLIIIPWVVVSDGDQSFPPKPPIPGFNRSPAIERLAP